MVFLSIVNFVRSRGPDEFWRKRKILKLSAHYFGRRRNCYSIAIKNVHRALAYATKGRALKKQDMKDLWDVRITAGVEQFGMGLMPFKEALSRNDIQLNGKTLADLAIWEPKTFEAIARIARERAKTDDIWGTNELQIDNSVFISDPSAEKK